MRLSKQFLLASLPPKNHKNLRTSELLTNGLVAHFSAVGIPFYMPVGKAILDNIEAILHDEADNHGFSAIDIPAIMGNDLLEDGQEIGELFRSKFMALTDRMEGYHLLSTPEMLFVKLTGTALISHRQLPIRQVYMSDFFRQIHDARSILKGKQFRVFGGISLERDGAGVTEGLAAFRAMTEASFSRIGLPFHVERNRGALDCEYFYLTDKEGDNLVLPDICTQERVKALSLAMAYHYAQDKKLPMRYRTEQNKNARPQLVTYGLGTQRLLYCVMDHYHDEKGFNLPLELRPFDLSVIPRSEREKDAAEKIYSILKKAGYKVCLDDRYKFNGVDREIAADYMGCGNKVLVSPDSISISARSGEHVATFLDLQSFETHLAKNVNRAPSDIRLSPDR
ncbi:MAG: hypothetical protein H6864_10025 [Micavibrio sp.]|nr:hypothetical protein [Micavibrio sp.]